MCTCDAGEAIFCKTWIADLGSPDAKQRASSMKVHLFSVPSPSSMLSLVFDFPPNVYTQNTSSRKVSSCDGVDKWKCAFKLTFPSDILLMSKAKTQSSPQVSCIMWYIAILLHAEGGPYDVRMR